jgi:hypothetical protein
LLDPEAMKDGLSIYSLLPTILLLLQMITLCFVGQFV